VVSVAGAATPPEGVEKKPAVAALPFGIFGSLEFETNATAGMNQWQHVQSLMAAEQKLYRECDAGDRSCPAYLASWRKNLKSWSDESGAMQLSLVNAWVNQQIRYTDDNAVFNRADYWASPAQSLKGRGDCEDYAIAKYASLKAMGYSDDRMRIIIVNDTRKNLGHAVLSVRTAQGVYILDNQNPRPVLHQQILYYAPVSSFNASGRWINIATRSLKKAKSAAVLVASAEEQGDIRPVAAPSAKVTLAAKLKIQPKPINTMQVAVLASPRAKPQRLSATAAIALLHISPTVLPTLAQTPTTTWTQRLLASLEPLASLLRPTLWG
jgi:predicted transglutaminase-like cysteine proteinase